MITNFWCIVKHVSVAKCCVSEVLDKFKDDDEKTFDLNLDDSFFFELFNASINLVVATQIHYPDYIVEISDNVLLASMTDILKLIRKIRDKIMLRINERKIRRLDVIMFLKMLDEALIKLLEMSKKYDVKLCELCEKDVVGGDENEKEKIN